VTQVTGRSRVPVAGRLKTSYIHDRNRSTVGSHRPGAFSECRRGDMRVRRFGLGPRVRNSCSRLLPPATPNAGRQTPVKMWHDRGAWARPAVGYLSPSTMVQSKEPLGFILPSITTSDATPTRQTTSAHPNSPILGLKGHERRPPESRSVNLRTRRTYHPRELLGDCPDRQHRLSASR
jgi:hypothetical protein